MERRGALTARTRGRILSAARQLLAETGEQPALEAVARRADVARVTLYNHFPSRRALLQALAAELAQRGGADALEVVVADADLGRALVALIEQASRLWAADTVLWRSLHALGLPEPAQEPREAAVVALVDRLVEADRLRPGCSKREAAEVLGLLTSFAAYDHLCRDGHRPKEQVAATLTRLAISLVE